MAHLVSATWHNGEGVMRMRGIPFGVAALLTGLLVLVPALAIVAVHHFDGLYGQDAFAYTEYALGPLASSLRQLELAPEFFWPLGFPLAILAASLLTGAGGPAGLLVGLACGVALVALIALLAREVLPLEFEPGTRDALALAAGVVAALCGQLLQSSVVAMPDTLAAAGATLGAWATCRYLARGRTLALVVAAAGLCLALETRWIYGLVALPLAVAGLVAIGRRFRSDRGRATAHFLAATATVVLVASPTLVPIVLAFARGQPVPFMGDFGVYSWSPLNALRSDFQTADGQLSYAWPTGLFYLVQPVAPYWFGILGLLAVPGLVAALRNRSLGSTAVLVAWPLLVIGFLLGGGYQNTRFFLAALPPVAILVVAGGHELWRICGQRRIGPFRWRSILVTAISLVLLANALLAVRFADSFVERMSADRAAIAALAARVPAADRLISLGATAALRHDARPDTIELNDLDEVSIITLLADGRETYLLVDTDAMREQFADLAPGRAVAALAAAGRLRPQATAGIWTLYLIAAP